MWKILSIILLVFLPLAWVFAANDMTSPDFTIQLNPMDPLSASHGSGDPSVGPAQGPSGFSGKWALIIILEKVSNLLLMLVPILAVLSLLIAGYYYIFSAWDSEKAWQAKNIIKWNLIAIIVAFMSFSIIQLIASLLSPPQ
jgi:hypothetical protein